MLSFFKNISIKYIALSTLFTLLVTGCADAGKSQNVLSGDNVTLDGSASKADFNGKIIHYKWKQISGTTVTLPNKESIRPTFIAPNIEIKEQLIFSLVTTEKGGHVSPWKTISIVDITVDPSTSSNHAPIALAQVDKTSIKYGQSVTFNASSSIDSDGHIISYSWKDQSNTVLSSEAQFTYTFDNTGTHHITLTVTDDDEASATDTINVSVEELQKPTATITANSTTIQVGESISFDAIGSTDTDGELVSYIWKDDNVILSTESSFTHTFTTLGEHIITLIVKDDDELEDITNVSITVTHPEDTIKPVITLRGDTTIHITMGNTYTDAGANAFDNIDGNITTNIETNNTVDTSKIGTYTVTYNVSDTAKNSAKEVLRTVIVKQELSLLIIRISFSDHQIQGDVSNWHNKIFGTSQGQLNHYYNEISYGKLQFKEALENEGTANDGIIDVTLPFNRADYNGSSRLFRVTAQTALRLSVDDYIDFSTYDKDNDGLISTNELQILFIVAGVDKSSFGGRNGTNVHAHTQSFVEGIVLDGVNIANYNNNAIDQGGKGGKYVAIGEMHDDSNGLHAGTIGQIAHEFGHSIFNLPDLYDTTNTSSGIGNFGLMADGAWGYNRGVDTYLGQTPVHMTGYCKMKAGFVKPTIITNNKQTLTITATSSNKYKLYKINTSVEGEYFLIENRASSGYDKGFSGSLGNDFQGGLLIMHIDENVETGNTVAIHKLVDIEEANNPVLDDKISKGHLNNLYFSGNADEFSENTTPNSNQYNGQESGIRIFNISEGGEVMTLDIEINP